MSFFYKGTTRPRYQDLNMNCVRHRRTDTLAIADAFFLHNQQSLELIAVTEGSLDVKVADECRTLREGEVAIVSPYKLHSGLWREPSSSFLCVTLDLSHWLSPFPAQLGAQRDGLLDGSLAFTAYPEDARELFSSICSLADLFEGAKDSTACRIAAITYALLDRLLCTHLEEIGVRQSRNLSFIRRTDAYLCAHYAEPIRSSDAAAALFLSHSQFCHTFKKSFGVPFSNYLCRYRIQRAAEDYRKSDLPLCEIALRVGFPDYCYFSRCFKKQTGMSAAQYFGRQKRKEEGLSL